jgi:hypothetical protein
MAELLNSHPSSSSLPRHKGVLQTRQSPIPKRWYFSISSLDRIHLLFLDRLTLLGRTLPLDRDAGDKA